MRRRIGSVWRRFVWPVSELQGKQASQSAVEREVCSGLVFRPMDNGLAAYQGILLSCRIANLQVSQILPKEKGTMRVRQGRGLPGSDW